MTDIVPSEELLAFMRRFYAAWQVWDFDTMRDMISAKPQLLIIGTDSAEWWHGKDALDIWMRQGKEIGSITIRSTALAAFSCGNVGWIADQIAITIQGVEDSISMRVTAVLAIERGHWRFVQMHASSARITSKYSAVHSRHASKGSSGRCASSGRTLAGLPHPTEQ